jgi:hypothetical protein
MIGEWRVMCRQGSGVWRRSAEVVWMSALAVYSKGGLGNKR